MKAYAQDLREHVLRAVDEGYLSVNARILRVISD
jgi:hypothetical protein